MLPLPATRARGARVRPRRRCASREACVAGRAWIACGSADGARIPCPRARVHSGVKRRLSQASCHRFARLGTCGGRAGGRIRSERSKQPKTAGVEMRIGPAGSLSNENVARLRFRLDCRVARNSDYGTARSEVKPSGSTSRPWRGRGHEGAPWQCWAAHRIAHAACRRTGRRSSCTVM